MKKFPITTARAEIVSTMPYFGVGLYGLVFVEEPRVPTMSVTKNLVLYYNPKFVESLDPYDLVSVLLHELLHVYGKTEKRFIEAGLRDSDRWHQIGFNIAADLAINSLLKAKRKEIPFALYPAKYGFPDRLTTEQYWQLLQNKKDEIMQDIGALAVCAGACGGAAGNADVPGIEAELDAKFGKSEIEKEALQESVAKAIQSDAFNKAWGSVKGEFTELIGLPIAKAVLPWGRILRRKINKILGPYISGGEYTAWSHPSRKSYATGIVRPGSINPNANIACIIDTSGSMGQDNLTKVLTEIAGILRSTENDYVWLIQADTKVQAPPTPVNCNNLKSLKVRGRGGTSFDSALMAADKIKPRPTLIIYFTDGYAPKISYRPKTNLLWVINSDVEAPSKHECVRLS